MLKTILSLLFINTTFFLNAQIETELVVPKRNTVYAEVLGQGLYNSISFDRLYRIEKKQKTSLSMGITTIPVGDLFVLGTPISYNYLLGQKKHHLELGFGVTPLYLRHRKIHVTVHNYDKDMTESYIGISNEFYSFFTPKIGYRFQNPNGGFFFRVTFTPALAGINVIGKTNGGILLFDYDKPKIEKFESAAFFGRRAMPWFGFSLGWTLKK